MFRSRCAGACGPGRRREAQQAVSGYKTTSMGRRICRSSGEGRFFYFLFSFFTKIYFRFGNLQKYTSAAPLPDGRDLTARQPGGRGFYAKTFVQIIACRSLGAGRPPGRGGNGP